MVVFVIVAIILGILGAVLVMGSNGEGNSNY